MLEFFGAWMLGKTAASQLEGRYKALVVQERLEQLGVPGCKKRLASARPVVLGDTDQQVYAVDNKDPLYFLVGADVVMSAEEVEFLNSVQFWDTEEVAGVVKRVAIITALAAQAST